MRARRLRKGLKDRGKGTEKEERKEAYCHFREIKIRILRTACGPQMNSRIQVIDWDSWMKVRHNCLSVILPLTVDSSFLLHRSDAPIIALLVSRRRTEEANAAICGTLRVLDLSGSRVGDAGAKILASFLLSNDTVERVFLSNNHIGTDGALAMADALKHNITLQSIFMTGNPIGQEGARAFINALRLHNVRLIDLFVSVRTIGARLTTEIKFLTDRNAISIPSAVRRVICYLIGVRCTLPLNGLGMLSFFPKEIVKMLAVQVFATRNDSAWIQAVD